MFPVSHEGDLAEEDLLLPQLVVRRKSQADDSLEGHAVCASLLLALGLGLYIAEIERVRLVSEAHLSIRTVYREYGSEHFLKPALLIRLKSGSELVALKEVLVGILLDSDQVWELTYFFEVGSYIGSVYGFAFGNHRVPPKAVDNC